MQMTKITRAFFLILMALIFGAGCAASGKTVIRQKSSDKLSNYKTLEVDVTVADNEFDAEALELERIVILRLREARLFTRVSKSEDVQKEEIRLRINVNALDRVSAASRFL